MPQVQQKHFYDASDISQILGVSERTAYYRIQEMNKDLRARGFYAEQGKIPKLYFYEKYPYIPNE
ncbi:hypothetical protein [Oceanobacillus kimchii]|uniref:hypothetical protein n=1 Tax=Oceanobacillus kimchii TaxID=746691 RepID=UPI003B0115E2